MANDIDIIVGVKDLATAVLEKFSAKVNQIGGDSKLAFAGIAERMNDQLSRSASIASSGSGALGGGNNDKLAKAIEAAANGLSTKLDAALAKTNTAIDGVVGKVQSAISHVTGLVTKGAAIATVGAAFVTVARGIQGATGAVASLAMGMNKADESTVKLKTSVLGSLAPFAKYVVAAGATATLTQATLRATSATSGLVEKVTSVGRGALAAFVLANALKKTETGASTLGAKLAKVAGFALAFDVASRATLRFGLSLLGVKKASDDATTALIKTANAGTSITAKVAAAPFTAIKSSASAAAAATANLSSKISELPAGAQSVNTLVSSFGTFAAQIGGIPGLLLAIPAAIAGAALAAVTAASQTERQLTQLTNKLAIVEAAKLNISIDAIDTAPLRKVAEEAEKTAKLIQAKTNVASLKLISLATSSLAKGLDPAQINSALKSAVGLAEVYGTSIEDGMYRTRQAIDGNFESFEKLIPAIKDMATNEEKIAAVSRLAANGFKVTAGESLTFWGTLEKVKNGLGNTIEAIGRMRSVSDLVATILRDVVSPAVEYLDKQLKGFGFNGGAVMEQATTLGATVIAVLETVGSNWDVIVARLTTGAELFWVQLQSQAEHFANTVLPWLGDNFVGMFEHAWAAIANNSKTQFQYMVTSAMESLGAVPKGTADFQKAENDKLPKFKPKALTGMDARNIGPAEAALQAKLDGLNKTLGNAFKTNFDTAFAGLDGALNDLGNVGDIALKVNGVKEPDAETEKKRKADTAQPLMAMESRLLTRGPAMDAAKFTAQNTAQSVAILKLMLAAQQREEAEMNRKKGRITNLVVVS